LATGLTTTVAINGSSTFYNLEFGVGSYGDGLVANIATTTVLSVRGDLKMSANGGYNTLIGGEIDVLGNITPGYSVGNAGYSAQNVANLTNVVLNGTSTQIVGNGWQAGSGNGFPSYGLFSTDLPTLTITKTIGTVTLIGFVDVFGGWTNTNGTVINAGTSTIIFAASSNTSTIAAITGSSTFNELGFSTPVEGYGSGNAIFTIATGTILTVSGDLAFNVNAAYPVFLGGGEIDVQGNIGAGYFAGGILNYVTSTASLVLNGTSTQVIGASSTHVIEGHLGYGNGWLPLPDTKINKASGVVVVSASTPIFKKTLTVAAGELQLATGTTAQTVEIDGALTINSGAILSDYAQVSSTITLGSSVTNNGTVWFDGAGSACGVSLPNYVILRSTASVQRSWSGTGGFIMRYVDVQYQTSGVPITVMNGTNSLHNGGGWSFTTGPRAQLIQSASSTGTTSFTLPAFAPIKPRAADLVVVAVSARNQSIAMPTDNAGNTYTLVSSSTFGSSPSYALSIYYAKNIVSTSSFAVSVSGTNSAGSPLLSASAFEYTGMNSSTTLDTYSANVDSSGSATALTSFSVTAQAQGELYFGAMTLSAPTTASSSAGWMARAGTTNNTTAQSLYVEDLATTAILTTSSQWTAATSTSYADILALFKTPYSQGYAPSGTLDSATFDTGVASGAQLNSIVFQGSVANGTAVKFQFAVSNSSNGPWNFIGPDGTTSSYFPYSGATATPGVPISLVSNTAAAGGYNLFSGHRYFRYRATLFSDPTQVYSPTVGQVTVNWSP
jgi:hypothetical protein